MSASDYVHLNVTRVLQETDKAFLLLLAGGREVWVPLSVVADPGDYTAGDENCTVSVRDWFAEKHRLEEEE